MYSTIRTAATTRLITSVCAGVSCPKNCTNAAGMTMPAIARSSDDEWSLAARRSNRCSPCRSPPKR